MGSSGKVGVLYLFVIIFELSEDKWEVSMDTFELLEHMTFLVVTIGITSGLE